MLSLFKWIIAVVVLFALVALLMRFLTSLGIDTRVLLMRTTSPTYASATAIVERLRSLSELHTAIAEVQVVVSAQQAKTMLGFEVGSSKLLYVCVGQVRAGIDLSKLSPNAFNNDTTPAHLTLPSPEILDTKIELDKSFIYDVRRSMMSPEPLYLHEEAQKKALHQILETSHRIGILGLAKDQAKAILTSFLVMLGHNDVQIDFQEDSPNEVQNIEGESP